MKETVNTKGMDTDTFQSPLNGINTSGISEFLDYLLPKLEKDLGITLIKLKRFSFVLEYSGEDIYFNIFKKPVDYDYFSYGIPFTKETVCIFYLFNYFDLEQLEKSIYTFLKEIILKDVLKPLRGIDGYYDVRYSKHDVIKANTPYTQHDFENLQYFYFKDSLACRKTIMDYNKCMRDIVSDLERIQGVLVEKAIQSDASESFYIALTYRNKKVRRNLKISVRNHPIHTKAQLCFYGKNYETLEDLRRVLVKTVKEFNWYNYKFDINNYLDVFPDKVLHKKTGEDMKYYTKEQLAFIENTKECKKTAPNRKMFGYLPTTLEIAQNYS